MPGRRPSWANEERLATLRRPAAAEAGRVRTVAAGIKNPDPTPPGGHHGRAIESLFGRLERRPGAPVAATWASQQTEILLKVVVHLAMPLAAVVSTRHHGVRSRKGWYGVLTRAVGHEPLAPSGSALCRASGPAHRGSVHPGPVWAHARG